MTAANALMQAVLRDPADTLARLVYAEEIERDEPERAEYIRLQIKIAEYESQPEQKTGGLICLWQARCHELFKSFDWDILSGMGNGVSVTYRRGFPSAISLPMALLMGGGCERCGGRRQVRYTDAAGDTDMEDCPDCHGTGRARGLIENIFARWPITEVRISDREPWDTGFGLAWYQHGVQAENSASIPRELFNRIKADAGINAAYFGTPGEANNALSHAIVDEGRHRARLPAIRRHGHDADAFHEQRKRIEQFQEQ